MFTDVSKECIVSVFSVGDVLSNNEQKARDFSLLHSIRTGSEAHI
jgi:hypothetical protein